MYQLTAASCFPASSYKNSHILMVAVHLLPKWCLPISFMCWALDSRTPEWPRHSLRTNGILIVYLVEACFPCAGLGLKFQGASSHQSEWRQEGSCCACSSSISEPPVPPSGIMATVCVCVFSFLLRTLLDCVDREYLTLLETANCSLLGCFKGSV